MKAKIVTLLLILVSTLQASDNIGQLLIEYNQSKGAYPLVHYAIMQNRPDVAAAALDLYPEQLTQMTPTRKMFGYDSNYDLRYVGEDAGISALELAITHQFPDLVRKLLDAGANPNETRLEYYGSVHTGKDVWLFRLGDELIKITNHGVTEFNTRNMLYWAITGGNEEIVEILVKAGAIIHDCDIEQRFQWCKLPSVLRRHALMIAAENDRILAKLISLQSGKIDIDSEVIKTYQNYLSKNLPELHVALAENDYDAFNLFLEYGSDPNYQGNAPEILVAQAIKHPDRKFIILLSEKMKDPSSVLDEAIKGNQNDLIVLLLDKGVTSKNALSLAIELHNRELFDLFLDYGLFDKSALFSAVKSNEKDMLLALIDKYGMDAATKNELSKLAISSGHNEILNILLGM